MSTPIPLSNAQARRLFLHRHGLAEAPAGPGRGADLMALIEQLGFVQIDSINTVARAHDMILFARRPAYRPGALKRLLERDRALFEHWTHDASVIPTAFFPHWRLRFERDRARLADRWKRWQRHGFEEKFDEVLARIAANGPVSSSDVGEDEGRSSGGWWEWHPSKTALEYLWRVGDLSVTRREGFRKLYDLTERVLPDAHATACPDPEETVDWACNAALDRLGFATSGEIAAFFATVSPAEAKAWCAEALARGEIVDVVVEGADGAPRRSFARPDVAEAAADAPAPPGRIRILSPFDPALRDRKRAERLFGFSYRIEVFVPEAQRLYGYYVFPVMEGDRLIGRIDMKARRDEGVLAVRAFWPEAGVAMGKGRLARLEATLDRMAGFAGCERVGFDPGWLREG
ncbi:winged helix-turn-helix domain-containing protein [Acidimangrovimonas sediminis]|uniref:winged helix-turn-helix domain-containing protein n=1 Tax=Acidimangrovimonas sediminis TaxID=2056283 RepID=UPI000C7FB2E2|nr:crosslink repair DNA glycosylase YcaQ family protein [Acidimangrovimonas sediminis]